MSYREFNNEEVNKLECLQEHYERWLTQRKQMKDPDEDYIDQDYTFVNFPWILDTQSKSDVLFLDSREKMKKEILTKQEN